MNAAMQVMSFSDRPVVDLRVRSYHLRGVWVLIRYFTKLVVLFLKLLASLYELVVLAEVVLEQRRDLILGVAVDHVSNRKVTYCIWNCRIISN